MELEQILNEVATGQLNVTEAAVRIRQLFARPRPVGPQGSRAPGGPPPLVSFIFAAVGAVCIVVAIAVAVGTANFGAHAASTEGEVIRMAVGSGRNPGHSPVVRFAVEGKSYEFQSSVSSNPPAHSVGQKVRILYNPTNPNEAQIDAFVDRWMLPLIFGLVGLVFFVIGFGMMVARLRQPVFPMPMPPPQKSPLTNAPPSDRPPHQ